MHAYTPGHKHTHKLREYMHTQTYICNKYEHIHACAHTHASMCAHIHTHACAHTHTHICMCSRVHTHTLMISFCLEKPYTHKTPPVTDKCITQSYLFPPKESCSRRVSLESLYGTWLPFFSLSPKAEITLPKASCKHIHHSIVTTHLLPLSLV